jgi:carboxypeptidase Q
MRRRALLQAATMLPLTAGAQTPAFDPADLAVADSLREAGQRDGTAWRLVNELAGGIGARPAGSQADARAVAWAQDACRALGLSAVRAEPVPLRIWQRGPASARLLAPEPRALAMLALGNSVPAPPEGIEADIAWYPDLAALLADTSERAKGRIVVIDQKTERTRDGSGYGRSVGARFAGPVEAAKRGAVAFALRSLSTASEPFAHTGATRYDLRFPRIPAFAVSVPDADAIAAHQAAGRPLRMQFKLEAREGVEALTHNVIAEVPGAGELAREIVLLSAHLDSWDLGQGAVDDGAGVAIVCAAAALIAKAGQSGRMPRRTLRVVLFGNEENGFDGARLYADRYAEAPHQLVSESDFGAGRVYRIASRVQPAALPLVAQMAEKLAPLGVELGANDGSPGPDAAVLMRRHRWPALQLSQDGSRYFDVHHTERDRLDQIEPAALAQNVAAWAVTGWLAAQSPVFFGPATL